MNIVFLFSLSKNNVFIISPTLESCIWIYTPINRWYRPFPGNAGDNRKSGVREAGGPDLSAIVLDN